VLTVALDFGLVAIGRVGAIAAAIFLTGIYRACAIFVSAFLSGCFHVIASESCLAVIVRSRINAPHGSAKPISRRSDALAWLGIAP